MSFVSAHYDENDEDLDMSSSSNITMTSDDRKLSVLYFEAKERFDIIKDYADHNDLDLLTKNGSLENFVNMYLSVNVPV